MVKDYLKDADSSPTFRKGSSQQDDKEWSLKGKEYWLTDKVNYIPDCDHQICNQKQINKFKRQKEEEEGTYYIKEDIDTLREKLIEDIYDIKLNIKEGIDHKDLQYIENLVNILYKAYEKEIIKIINKRFGVED